MSRLRWLAAWPPLILCVLTFVAAPASADEYSTSAACAGVFKLDALPEQLVVLVPSQVHERVPATVCVLGFWYVTHVDVTQDRQHLTVTLYDSGFSWSPNPPIVVSGELPPLPAGTYTMDVVVAAADSANDPYAIARNFPVVVAAAAQLAPLPTLNGYGLLVAILTLASAALLRMRVARAPQE
jgi:hypothetical protein